MLLVTIDRKQQVSYQTCKDLNHKPMFTPGDQVVNLDQYPKPIPGDGLGVLVATPMLRVGDDNCSDTGGYAALGFEKAFDIAWISMSPAVQTLQDFEKMEKCAGKWCVYIGWGRKRKNALMEEVFNLHNLDYGPPAGVEAAYDILVRSGRTPSLDYFETSWD